MLRGSYYSQDPVVLSELQQFSLQKQWEWTQQTQVKVPE